MENIHGGHRDRMRSRYLQEGPDGFADHELLEMLLYGCIPRGDTNPVAHLLLKEFGSLSNLLESDAHEIAKTEGVGLKSAIFLTQLHEVIRRYEREKLGSKPELTSITRCVEYCRQLLSHYREILHNLHGQPQKGDSCGKAGGGHGWQCICFQSAGGRGCAAV